MCHGPDEIISYAYDAVGNRTAIQRNETAPITYTYHAANQATTTDWSYDAAGNLTSDGTHTYTYDALNRLTSTDDSSYTTMAMAC